MISVPPSRLVWENLNTGPSEKLAAFDNENSKAGATRYCCCFTLWKSVEPVSGVSLPKS